MAAAIAAAAAAHLNVTDDMEVDADPTHQQAQQAAAVAATAAGAGAGVVAPAATAGGPGDMKPPANRTGKRSKAAISSSSSQPGSTSSPFRAQQQGLAVTAGAPEGLSPLLAVQNPGHQGSAAALNRSASQSPPYKAPRYRRKQTPSRFYCPAEGTTAAELGSQQQHQHWGSQLEEVVVVAGGSSGGGSSDQPSRPAAHQAQAVNASAPSAATKGSPAKSQQLGSSTPKAELKSSGSNGGSDGNAVPGETVQQLVTQARAAVQQQRWQQLQQRLKGQLLAGGGVVAEQLEAQEQVAKVQVRPGWR